MLAAVILAVLCSQQVLGAAAVEMHDLHLNMEACMQETGSTMDEILAWADGGDASENLKCQMKCIMMKTNSLTEDGHLVMETMLEMMPAEEHPNVMQCAAIEQGGELCDLAYRHQKCMREKSPAFYSDFVKNKAMS